MFVYDIEVSVSVYMYVVEWKKKLWSQTQGRIPANKKQYRVCCFDVCARVYVVFIQRMS